MTRAELITGVSAAAGITKTQAERAINAVAGNVVASVLQRGESTKIAGLGIFKPKHTEARVGRNPKTGDSIPIPAKDTIGFKVSL